MAQVERKVVFCGSKGVGKSHAMYKLVTGKNAVGFLPTLGVEVMPVLLESPVAGRVMFNLWDVAGSSVQHTDKYFYNADYVFVFYNSAETLQEGAFWQQKAPVGAEILYVDTSVIDLSVASKQDLEDATVGRVL